MSARKPLARMDSPAVTESIEKAPPTTDNAVAETADNSPAKTTDIAKAQMNHNETNNLSAQIADNGTSQATDDVAAQATDDAADCKTDSAAMQTAGSSSIQTTEPATTQTTDSAIIHTADAVSLQTTDSATIQTADAVSLQTTDSATTQTAISIIVTREENTDKLDLATINDMKEIQIKKEKLDPEEALEAKRMTRNSPTMTVTSPSKKVSSDSLEQQHLLSDNTTQVAIDESKKSKDKTDKPTTSRGRKSSDKQSSTSVPPTNRLTRKAAMKDWAANTRLTRARRASGGMAPRPETPPKRKYVFKKNLVEPPAPAVKRKRSYSPPKQNSEEPEAKFIKIEDPGFDLDSITIKQEILESSEEMTSDVASDITDIMFPVVSSRISLRTRKTPMCYSPTTRAYRRGKDKPDGTKKKQNRVRPDEDSKDSMASSTIDEMVEVKTEEKFQPENTNQVTNMADISFPSCKSEVLTNGSVISMDESGKTSIYEGSAVTIDKQPIAFSREPSLMPMKSEASHSPREVCANDAIDSKNSQDLLNSAESTDTPLIVDTTEAKKEVPTTSAAAATSEQSNSSDKSASLSPELFSEGVSEMSVKQFYKEPEFLENNLGIEDDPKLGEIVQNVADRMDDTIDQTSVSNESIKEGELVFEEDDEDAESIGTIKNEHEEDEDANSVSTGFISPLLVEEEEEEEENDERTFLNGDENVEETSNSGDVLPEEEDKLVADEPKETIIEAKEINAEESNSEGREVEDPKLDVKEANTQKMETEEIDSTETNTHKMEKDADEATKLKQVPEEEPLKCSDVAEKFVDIKKTEVCDETIKNDNETKIEDSGEIKPNLVEKNEEFSGLEKEVVEKMEQDDPKIEASEPEESKIKADQEENKENMELISEVVVEDCQEVNIKPQIPQIEKESSADEQEESPSESSNTTSLTKAQAEESSGDTTTPSTSPQSSKSLPSSKASCLPRTPENDEKLRQKERHLKTLGLLTHKAADEAIMAKQKRRKFLHNLSNNSSSRRNAANAAANAAATAGNGQNKSSQEYTGTLKTIIKINRQTSGGSNGGGSNGGGSNSGGGGGGASEPKKSKNGDGNSANKATTSGYGNRRQSLKMTFQKGRGRPANTEKSGENPANTSGEDSYYTIQNEAGEATTSATTAVAPVENATTVPATTNLGRKSYNRSSTLNLTDPSPQTEHHEVPAINKKDEKEEILIPEKASSFKFHPGRLCQDQCYYCSGKFGLYDTPCHVGQIKSVERQQKILSNEEKLTVDNCLCDACFRHVDRRANVPSYKKRLSVPGRIETTTTESPASATQSPPEEEKPQHIPANGTASAHTCAVPDCGQKAAHSLRRKSIRKSIKKSLLNFDMSTAGTYLYICDKHYEAVVQSSGCVLCKRRLGKNNMYHITTDTDRLEKALADMGIPVTMGQCTAVCKLCRYFANLLMKPPEHGKVQKIEFVKNYRKRLLQFYNIHDKKDSSLEEEKSSDKEKSLKKQKSSDNTKIQEPTETIEVPSSPTPSTGSSVEMISDGGLFSSDETRAAEKSSTSTTAVAVAGASNSTSNQMVLDNDVLVDYDVPMISDTSSSSSSKSTSPSPQKIKKANEQQSKLKAILQSVGTSLEDRSDISTALRSNPNISMRELFPGEEDLGLQFKAPFGGSSSQRTPEGWTRINTFLQYDEPTRRLWEDLQKPYGNQSSFLRHLILLEKYYRNGDLILSSNASSNATVYTQTVRNRLTSFDSRCSSPSSAKQIESRSRSLSVDKIQRQLSSNSVTIIARPKETQKEPENTKQKDLNTSNPVPIPMAVASSTPNSRSILKANVGAPKGNSSVEIVSLNSTPSSKSTSPQSPNRSGSTTPNDSSTLTKQQKILAAANKLMSNKLDTSPTQKKPALNTTPPELISLNRRPAAPAISTQQVKRPLLLPKPMKPIPPNVVVLPDNLTVQERLESKSWRPTLLPVTTNSHHLNNQMGPLYQTADGRRLPALVQVQSGGRPFLISIHDYNRMCILRREKLMRDQMLKGSKGKLKGPIFPPATCTPNSISSKPPTTSNPALMTFTKMQALNAAENAAKKQRLMMAKPPNYTPIAPKNMQTSLASTSATATCTSQTQSQSNVKPPAINLKPISLLSATPVSIHPNLSGPSMTQLKPATTTAVSGVPSSSWLWNNFPDPNQMLMNGKSATVTATTSKGPQATFATMKQQSLLLDNSLMSKIPKSLTVIPQHKLMPAPPSGQMSGGSITKNTT